MTFEFPLIERKEVATGTMMFTFDRSGSGYQFKAGQNADFTLTSPPHTDAEGNTRTFSFVSSPQDEGRLSIATRMRDTAFKNSLKELPLGTKVQLSEPMGQFTLHRDITKPAVFLVGGIGITPFHSMILDSTERQTGHKITLLYSNKDLGSTTFFEDLKRLTVANPNFTFVPVLTDDAPDDWQGERSRIDRAMVLRHVPNMNGSIFYTAGPLAMVKAMQTLLEELQVPEEQVKIEEFAGY